MTTPRAKFDITVRLVAIDRMLAGEYRTVAGMARELGTSERTVRRYIGLIQSMFNRKVQRHRDGTLRYPPRVGPVFAQSAVAGL